MSVPSCRVRRKHGMRFVMDMRQKKPQAINLRLISCHLWTYHKGSPNKLVDPPLKSPVATVGGAVPEHTGLPYLSRRCDR